jgi:hypothetical protein
MILGTVNFEHTNQQFKSTTQHHTNDFQQSRLRNCVLRLNLAQSCVCPLTVSYSTLLAVFLHINVVNFSKIAHSQPQNGPTVENLAHPGGFCGL